MVVLFQSRPYNQFVYTTHYCEINILITELELS